MEFSATTEEVLRRAGWSPGREDRKVLETSLRKLCEQGGFEPFEAALRVVREYGGLCVKASGPGVNFAKMSFEVDPTLAAGEEDRFADFERDLGVQLFPLGEIDGGHAFLAIADDGRTFSLMGALDFLGQTFEDAVEGMIQGRVPR
jgi:hypothetical protein